MKFKEFVSYCEVVVLDDLQLCRLHYKPTDQFMDLPKYKPYGKTPKKVLRERLNYFYRVLITKGLIIKKECITVTF